jgi:hypothetical protein
VLATARNPQRAVKEELWAIIWSPWEEANYASGGIMGAKLLAAYDALYPARPSAAEGNPPQSWLDEIAQGLIEGKIDEDDIPGVTVRGGLVEQATGAASDAVDSVAGAAGDALRFVQEKAALAFLYLVLTGLAAVLIVMGLLRATGTSPASVRAGVAGRLRPVPDDIPF